MPSRSSDPAAEIIRTNLRRFREDVGLSQPEAADLGGLAVDALRRYENGRSRINFTDLQTLARLYGRGIEEFYQTDPKAPATPPVPPVYILKPRRYDDHFSEEDFQELTKIVADYNERARNRGPRKPGPGGRGNSGKRKGRTIR